METADELNGYLQVLAPNVPNASHITFLRLIAQSHKPSSD